MLITNYEQFKQHVVLVEDFDFSTLAPHLRRAERMHLLPMLGPLLYNALVQHVAQDEASGSGSGNGNGLLEWMLPYVREPLALLAMRGVLPMLNVKITEAGLHTTWSEHYRNPQQWQVGDLAEGFQMSGMAALDHLYDQLLRRNPMNWYQTGPWMPRNKLLLRYTEQFQEHYPIGNSHTTFMDLLPAIRRAQDLDLAPVVGGAFMQALVAVDEHASGSGSGNSDLMVEAVQRLRAPLAHFAVARATDVMFRFVDGGLMSTRYERNAVGAAGTNNQNTRAQYEVVDTMRRNASATGHALLGQVHAWLDEHAAQLPIYQAGPGYRPPTTTTSAAEDRIHNASGGTMV